jgi:hypothetical protein
VGPEVVARFVVVVDGLTALTTTQFGDARVASTRGCRMRYRRSVGSRCLCLRTTRALVLVPRLP